MAAALHIKLLTDISDMMEIDSPEYINFVFHMTQFVAKGLLNSKRNLLDKFAAMKTKGKLDIGKYDNLKKVAEDSGNDDVLEIIQEKEPEILEALASEKGGKICGPSTSVKESGQSTSTAPSGQFRSDDIHPGQSNANVSRASSKTKPDTTGPAKRPAKRPRTEVDSSDPLHYTDHEEHGYYDNTGKRGLLLILDSKEDRKGTEKDVENLKGFFGDSGLRFEVFDPREHEEDDLTTEQIDGHLNDVRAWLNGSLGSTRYYCFICVIMSHGNEDGIKTRNGSKSVDEIRRFFNNRNMPKFAGRPKIFFIQACRGKKQQDSQEIDDADDEIRPAAGQNDNVDEADEIIRIPTDADTLLAYATTPGYLSFRRRDVGSWFITECMDVFKKYHKKDHLEDMFITVREKVALDWIKQGGAKQMPCVWSTLTKRLMLT